MESQKKIARFAIRQVDTLRIGNLPPHYKASYDPLPEQYNLILLNSNVSNSYLNKNDVIVAAAYKLYVVAP